MGDSEPVLMGHITNEPGAIQELFRLALEQMDTIEAERAATPPD